MDGNWKTETKVTRLGSWYHCRLYVNDQLFMENACQERADIGLVCALQMRDVEKYYGRWNQHTMACRKRLNARLTWAPLGRVKAVRIKVEA